MVRIRGAALGRIISNVHTFLCTAYSCLPLTVPIRFPFHLGESIFLCSSFFHNLSALLHPYVTNLVSLTPLLFQASCSPSFSWVPAVVEVSEHRRYSSLFSCDIPSHCSPCCPGQMIEGKACSSSAAILLEMCALGNVYRSCVEVEYV